MAVFSTRCGVRRCEAHVFDEMCLWSTWFYLSSEIWAMACKISEEIKSIFI